ncbi:MAG: NAD(P)-dependent glycerol-3-phosphate dehydrogenase [Acholeplasmataceae bacterium]|nr:NAD(P)-dependent glycerol-3-phosphate dehydrogenase [Acholeplasmataceae bacterium]
MKVAILGGGAWGTTLAQVLVDNGHEVLIYDNNLVHLNKINQQMHPFFDVKISPTIKGTADLDKFLDFSSYLLIALPTASIRDVLYEINLKLKDKKVFINVSKGIEPETTKRVSQIVDEVISKKYNGGYVLLTGPSHSEEVIVKKLTLLTSSSKDLNLAKEIQKMFSNNEYLRVYVNDDVVGAEVGGTAKNAIAVVSGAATGLKLGENARAALITRGSVEIVRVVEAMGGQKETAYGLTGIGDLIVTASSENSRNFRAGRRIGEGVPLEQVFLESEQTIEGVRSIIALHEYAEKEGLYLPIISTAYRVLFEGLDVKEAIQKLLTGDLKEEKEI